MKDDRQEWKNQRFIYELLKEQAIFRLWKKDQFLCQRGECAYCRRPMQYRYSETDHFTPLYRGGTSEAVNMYLVHHSCNKYKGIKTYNNDLSWIDVNKYSKSVSDRYYKLYNENIANNTYTRSPYITKFNNLDNVADYVVDINVGESNVQNENDKFLGFKKNILIFIKTCLIVCFCFFIILPFMFYYNNNQAQVAVGVLSDTERVEYLERALIAYSEWYNKYGMPIEGNSLCGDGYLGSVKLENRLECDMYVTYSTNNFSDAIKGESSIAQNGELPGATKNNVAIYKVGKCAENFKSQNGIVLLTRSLFIRELIGVGSFTDVAVVIRLSDGMYYCLDNQ